jgi:peptidoglycan/LPS O-acetylase OafA/YrhL
MTVGFAKKFSFDMSTPAQPLDFFRRVDEFDVLRAIAVIGVVASHVWGLAGGFIGVDIFFVISGYVITLLLLKHFVDDKFSFKNFYYRRIDRILPPLFVVSIVIYLFSWFVFYQPEDSVFIRESFLFQSFFAQNFYFMWRSEDYFQGLSNAKLNLHTWSLAVEEQFYLIYPLVFLLFYRFRQVRWMPWMLGIIFVTSFIFLTNIYERYLIPYFGGILNIDFLGHVPKGVRYYLIFPRVWQLLLGAAACLVIYLLYSKRIIERIRMSSTFARLIVIGGVCILMLSFVFIKKTMDWPSIITLMPLVVIAGLLGLLHLYGAACLPSLLNSRLLHIIGKSSYSLYLWHWPVLGMLIYTNSDFGSWWLDYPIYFLLIGLLTAVTYLFIEQRRFIMRPHHAWIIFISFVGFSVLASQLERSREAIPEEILTVLETGVYSERCDMCVERPTNQFFILWGDSHSQMLSHAAAHAALNAGFQLVHIKGSLAEDRKRLVELTTSPFFKGIVLASRWSMYAVGFPLDEPEEVGTRYLSVDGNFAQNRTDAGKHFQTLLQRFLEDINGKPILFLLEVPRYPFFPKKELLMDLAGLKIRPLSTKSLSEHRSEQQETRQMIETITAQYPRVLLADPAVILCPEGICNWHDGGKIFYKDDDHLSVYGSEKLTPIFKNFFDFQATSSVPNLHSQSTLTGKNQ